MAEDDDDDSFGDFTFATFNNNPSTNHQQLNQINAPRFTMATTTTSATSAAANGDDDDEWGDFVESPLGSNASSINTPAAKPFDPFNFFAANPITQSQSESGGVQLEEEKKESQWVKLKGAIPLSIFGDVEEEEKEEEVEGSGVSDPHGTNGKDSKFDLKKNGNFSNGFKSNGYLGGSFGYDVIASLYNQNSDLNLSKKDSSLMLNGLNLESESLARKSDNDSFMNLSSHNDSKNQEMKTEDGVNASSNGVQLRLDALDLDFGGWNTGFNGLGSKSSLDLDIKYDLNDRNLDGKAENDNAQSRLNYIDLAVKDTENPPFSWWNSNLDGFKLNSSAMESSLEGLSSNVNGVANMGSDFKGGHEELVGGEDDDDADGWEFKDAYAESKVKMGNEKARLEVQEVWEENSHSSGSGNGTNRSIDLFTMSNGSRDMLSTPSGASSKSNGFDIGSNIKSIAAKGNALAPDTCLRIDQKGHEAVLYPHPVAETAESDEDFGDFTAAFAGAGLMQEADSEVRESSRINASSSGFTSGSNGSLDFFSASDGAVDLFAPSNRTFGDFSQVGGGFDIKPSIIVKREASKLDAFSRSELTDGVDLQDHSTVIQNAVSGEPVSEFRSAFEENALVKQENAIELENHKGALPLSIFGDEELETDGSLNADDSFMFQSASSKGNSHSTKSAISINDLISNLYSQAGPISSVSSMQNPVVNGLHLSDSFSGSNLVPAAEDVDNSSWEFKDAVFQNEANKGTSLSENEDVHQTSSGKLKLQIFMDFYSKLQDELYLIAKGHLASLKETQNDVNFGEDAGLDALIEEIQMACDELGQANAIIKEEHLGNSTQSQSNLHDFLEVLQEPGFCVLETEYDLQRRLSLVEKDAKSAMELIGHVKTMLKILMMGSLDEQHTYVSVWSKMINICAQELQHGAQLWRESLQKNIQSQILAEPQGKTFVIALGEIYRVAVLLGATAKLYKPWILSTPVESSSIYSLLDQCHSSWSASGLEEALAIISDSTPAKGHGSLASLLDSIKYLCDLDAFALQNKLFIQHESLCWLSLMPQTVAPGMTMVVWNEEQCFLKLANLWANLISSDRPKLPPLLVNG
ncbi:uncharacterized protein [Coffea arabica]|uniref:Synergin gamma C-terminal domain-containing protein n=1 Tax=Coffea arabica TaxID=13443 RepID=A0A6P6W5N9_COFAR|nr:uncharacterized protein LOC113729408 [Coffea arabica]